jgi:YD repeat-containing protein
MNHITFSFPLLVACQSRINLTHPNRRIVGTYSGLLTWPVEVRIRLIYFLIGERRPFLVLFLLFALTCFMTACKKDDQTTPSPATTTPPSTTCRLSELTWKGSTPYGNTFTFDKQGRVIKSKDISTGKEGVFAYDTNGYLLTYTISNVDGQGRQYSSEVRKFTYANGRLTQLTYNLIVKGQVELEKKIKVTLNAAGNITSLLTSDGTTQSYSYDRSGNLIMSQDENYVEEYANYDTQRNPGLAVITSEAHKLVIHLDAILANGFSKNNPRSFKRYRIDAAGNRSLFNEVTLSNFSYNQSDLPTQFMYSGRTPQGDVSTGTYTLSYTNCQ